MHGMYVCIPRLARSNPLVSTNSFKTFGEGPSPPSSVPKTVDQGFLLFLLEPNSFVKNFACVCSCRATFAAKLIDCIFIINIHVKALIRERSPILRAFRDLVAELILKLESLPFYRTCPTIVAQLLQSTQRSLQGAIWQVSTHAFHSSLTKLSLTKTVHSFIPNLHDLFIKRLKNT